jgi:hypothetical protein
MLSVPFAVRLALCAFLVPEHSADFSPSRSSEVHSLDHPLVVLLLKMKAVIDAPSLRPIRKGNHLCKEEDTCPGVSSCAERFSDSPSGAITPIQD